MQVVCLRRKISFRQAQPQNAIKRPPEKKAEVNLDDLMRTADEMPPADDPLPVNEIEVYRGLAPPRSGTPILEWWKNQDQLPVLRTLAYRVLGIQGSSVASEGLFSNADFVVNDKRTSLSSEKLDDLLYLKWNDKL